MGGSCALVRVCAGWDASEGAGRRPGWSGPGAVAEVGPAGRAGRSGTAFGPAGCPAFGGATGRSTVATGRADANGLTDTGERR